MARPLSATDEQILNAAMMVLRRHGVAGLTVSEVAREIGLSRAALHLRFDNAGGLQRALFARLEANFSAMMAMCTTAPGSTALLEIAERIGQLTGGRNNLAREMAYPDGDDAAIAREFAKRRGDILMRAIQRAMPPTAIDPLAAAHAFRSHITGSLMAWQASEEPDAQLFLRERTLDWLRLVGLPAPERVDLAPGVDA
jgi:AcrR family transcriptional regulator